MPDHQGFARPPAPATLEGHGVRLAPLQMEYASGLAQAASDGELWTLRVTSVPGPGLAAVETYIRQALAGQSAGHMLPFAVIDADSGQVIGSTRYHDIVPAVARLEIGYTWYARSRQRSHEPPRA